MVTGGDQDMTVTLPLKPPRQTANPAPPRRPDSIRRTASIDVDWTDGPQSTRRFHGRARDWLTPAGGGAGRTLREARMEARLDLQRTILAIESDPAPPHLGALVGERGGGHLRMVLRERLPELVASGDPLYLLLDDISGVSLISAWAWSLWNRDWLEGAQAAFPPEQLERMMNERANVCWGLQTGNSGLDPDRTRLHDDAADGGSLVNPADPQGWHAFPETATVSMRRARRIDVWREPDAIRIDSAFQDSAPRADGTRAALHEYRLTASLDPETLSLLTLVPEPRVLPFHECPGAVANAAGLVGTPLPAIRETVLKELRGPAGCTHLNDALRALAEVPLLLAQLV